MKKIVISGSAKLQDKIKYWNKLFSNKNYKVLDYPKPIEKEKFKELYRSIHKTFFQNIIKTDMLFVMNEDKNGIKGYKLCPFA